MRYELMRPSQLREAIAKRTPIVLPLGVLEYHSEHLPVGMDTLAVERALWEYEKEADVVILPSFYWGASSRAVAPCSDGRGSIPVDSQALVPIARQIFRGLLDVGFRNIHCFVAHQTEEFVQGMPTDLAFRFAGRKVIFEFLDDKLGKGWWGKEENSSYYSGGENPFAYIQVHPVRTRECTKKRFKGDHAGFLETSEMLAMHPETVDMSKLDGSLWFTRTAVDATAEFGAEALRETAIDVKKVLFGDEA